MSVNNNPPIDEIRDLYEQLERDKDLYKEFIKNEDSFLRKRGYEPEKVKGIIKQLTKDRMDALGDVLESHGSELEKK